MTLQGQEPLQLKRLRKTSSYYSTSHCLWYLIINLWVCIYFLPFPGGTFGRSVGSVHTWDGAIFAQARHACSVEQRSDICFLGFMHHTLRCIYQLNLCSNLIYGDTGVVELVSDFVVCEEGKPLSPESARILVRSCFIPLNLMCSDDVFVYWNSNVGDVSYICSACWGSRWLLSG